jgi:alkylation response protein AidB-like acyl-CoA dehydrogenase
MGLRGSSTCVMNYEGARGWLVGKENRGMEAMAETGMEQFVRDARITMLYEGSNGVQALDLVACKLARDDGRAIKAFIGSESVKPLAYRLETALVDLEEATEFFYDG